MRVFSQDEKQSEKDGSDLFSAFKMLAKNRDEEKIELAHLKQMLELYDKEYKPAVTATIIELMLQINDVIAELRQSGYCENDTFYYKKYLDEQIKKKK